MWKRPLITIIMFLLIYSMISTVFAILNKLPYEFGGTGSPDTVAADSLTHGTAISPPITVLILLAVLAILTSRRGWIGTVAIIGVILLAILFLVAGLGEPIIWRTLQARTFGMFEFAVLGLSLVGFILSLCTLIFGYRELIERRRAQR